MFLRSATLIEETSSIDIFDAARSSIGSSFFGCRILATRPKLLKNFDDAIELVMESRLGDPAAAGVDDFPTFCFDPTGSPDAPTIFLLPEAFPLD